MSGSLTTGVWRWLLRAILRLPQNPPLRCLFYYERPNTESGFFSPPPTNTASLDHISMTPIRPKLTHLPILLLTSFILNPAAREMLSKHQSDHVIPQHVPNPSHCTQKSQNPYYAPQSCPISSGLTQMSPSPCIDPFKSQPLPPRHRHVLPPHLLHCFSLVLKTI